MSYSSGRTGAATKRLLDLVDYQGVFSSQNNATFGTGAMIYATGSTRAVASSTRVTDQNAVIAASAVVADGLVLGASNGASPNSVKTDMGDFPEGLAEIIVATDGGGNKVAKVVSNYCDLDQAVSIGTGNLSGATTALATLLSNRKTLVGVYLQFTFGGSVTRAAVISERGDYIGATFCDDSNVYHLWIDKTSGDYVAKYIYKDDETHFLVQPSV